MLIVYFIVVFASIYLSGLVFEILILLGIIMICIAQFLFSHSNKRNLVLFSLEGNEMREQYIGRIVGTQVPSQPFQVQKNYFANKFEIHFHDKDGNDFKDAWKLIIPYRNRVGWQSDVIFGSLINLATKKGDKGEKLAFSPLLTADMFKELLSSQSVLKHVTSSMNKETDDKISQFETQTNSLLELTDRLEEIKKKTGILMRRLNSPTMDFLTLMQEVFGLHPDEINKVAAEQIIEKAKRRDEILNLYKEGKITTEQLSSLEDIETTAKSMTEI